ncbi:MAG: hypothetical protein NTY03_08475 [Candidatus Bathyarchaeota archaeon]|nr:hypothetical protein [Candidatus Bathyarchaeota archaeon]
MNPKKYLNHFRGWLPKAPSFPNPQTTKMVEANQKTKKPKTRLAFTFIITFAAVFSTLYIMGVLGLGSYAGFAAGAVTGLITLVLSVFLWKPCNQISKPGEMNK